MAPVLLAAAPRSLDVWSLVMDAGPMAKFILFILMLVSVASWAIMSERFRAFRRAERESKAFLEQFQQGGTLAALHGAASAYPKSPLADVFRAGFREITLNPRPEGAPLQGAPLEALDRMLRKSASSQMTRLERSLGFLATTASASPFIGLFGTVWGIMNAFRGIGVAGTASLAAYAPGIAEALVATAVGIAVALPAVAAYNYLQRRLASLIASADVLSSLVLAYLSGTKSEKA